MTITSIPPNGSESEKEAKISEQDLASIAGGQQISTEQVDKWLAMVKDPNTRKHERKGISARRVGLPVDGKHYDGSTPT